jgi:phosphatidate cytidylyltransferase
MGVRVLSAAVLVALLIVTIWWLPPWATVGLATIAAAMGGVELAGLARRAGVKVPAAFAATWGVLGCVAFAFEGGQASGLSAVIPFALLAMFVSGCLSPLEWMTPGPRTFSRPATIALAGSYVGIPMGTLAWARLMAGPGAVTWLIAVIAISDSAQYFTGRAIGRRKLAPVISPGKTIEGALGGLVAAIVAGALLARLWLPTTSAAVAGATAAALAIVGMAGDLFESLLKRSVGAKDSSQLIPGHGGVLDRVDAYLFAGPTFYVFLRFVL